MSDARDTQKVKSLPDDLRTVAEDMLAEKFGYAKKGEVQEKPKKAPSSKTKKSSGMSSEWMSAMRDITQSNYATSTLTFKDVQRAVDSMRKQTGEYGISPEEWCRIAEKGYEQGTYPYRPEMGAFELVIESPYTGRRNTMMIDVHRMRGYSASDGFAYEIRKRVEHTSREYMEPFVIVDPHASVTHRSNYFEKVVMNEPFLY